MIRRIYVRPCRPYAFGATKQRGKKRRLDNVVAGTSKIQSFFVTTTAGEDETCEGNPGNSNGDVFDVAPPVPPPFQKEIQDKPGRVCKQLQDTRQSLDPSLIPISSVDAKELCDNLNTFYARFDSKDNYSTLIHELETVCDNDNPIDKNEHEVRLLFKELNSRKSQGPDNISPLLLKSCHELSGVYQHLFQLSISSGIPRIWNTAVIVPVPKKTTAKEYNDDIPIALTSVTFKCIERILSKHLLPEIEDYLDPYQLYRKNKSAEDATLLYNNLVVEHLENKNAYVRSVLIDFGSAFNTLKPDIVINKLMTLNVSPILCKLIILDFLTNREQ